MMRVNIATATASLVNHDHHDHHWRGCHLLLPSSYPWHKKRTRTNNIVQAQVEFLLNVLCYCIELTYFLDLGFIYGTTTLPRQNHDEGRHRNHTGTKRTPSTTAVSTARRVGTGTTTNGGYGNSGPNGMRREPQRDGETKERRQEMRGRR